MPPPSIGLLLKHGDFNVKLDGQVFDISQDIKAAKSAHLIYNAELRGGETFRVTKANNRDLKLGIVDSVGYDKIKESNFEDFYGGFDLWFAGYSRSPSLSGNYPATFESDPQAFNPGGTLYLEYQPGFVAIYNDDKSIDLVSKKLLGTPPYYFYLKFFVRETAATLERVR